MVSIFVFRSLPFQFCRTRAEYVYLSLTSSSTHSLKKILHWKCKSATGGVIKDGCLTLSPQSSITYCTLKHPLRVTIEWWAGRQTNWILNSMRHQNCFQYLIFHSPADANEIWFASPHHPNKKSQILVLSICLRSSFSTLTCQYTHSKYETSCCKIRL
jgi:hypothetical protein